MTTASPPATPTPLLPLRARIVPVVVHGTTTAIVASLCCVVAPKLGIREAYWSAISCIIVMQSEVAATVTASRDRLLGTAIGGIIGWGCSVVWGGEMVVYAAAVALSLAVCGAFGLASAGRISAVTVSIIVLLPRSGPAWLISLHRLLGVSFGVVVGLCAALAVAKLSTYIALRARETSIQTGSDAPREG